MIQFFVVFIMLLICLSGLTLILSNVITALCATFMRRKLITANITTWMDNTHDTICIVGFVLSIIAACAITLVIL